MMSDTIGPKPNSPKKTVERQDGPIAAPIGAFGAEIRQLDLRRELDARTADWLRSLFAERHLLLFRNQRIAPEDQIRIMAEFGNVLDEAHDGSRHTYISTGDESLVKPGRLLFHSDNHFTPLPLEALSLYGEVVDAAAAPTLFVDNVLAFRRLPASLGDRIAHAKAINASYYFFDKGGDRPASAVDPDILEAPRAVHPLVWRHPQTGEPILYVTELHTRQVEGLTAHESRELLKQLHEVLYAPDKIYEHHWRTGDLIVWDNRAVQHARGPVPGSRSDPGAPKRSLRRVVLGEKDYVDQMKQANR